jgi:hypothetical protein
MSDEDSVIDVEAEEIPDAPGNLPAVIPKPTTGRNGTHERAEPMPNSADAPNKGRDWSTYSRPERRCTAHSSRTGEQCKNVAIKGHNVCRYHGGAAKQIKQAAQTRLDNAAEVMAKQLLGIAMSADSEAVKLAAVKDALDRTIGKAPTTVEIGPTKPYEELFEGIASGTRAESRRARGVPDAEYNFAGFAPPGIGESFGVATQQDPADQSQPAETLLRRESVDPTTYTGEPGSGSGQAGAASDYSDLRPEHIARQFDPASGANSAVHRHRPRDHDGDTHAGRPARHISGMEAIREANAANRQIGALKAIESPHKRYRRP